MVAVSADGLYLAYYARFIRKSEAKLWVEKPGRISRQGGLSRKFCYVCVVQNAAWGGTTKTEKNGGKLGE